MTNFPRSQFSLWAIFRLANFPRGQFSAWQIFCMPIFHLPRRGVALLPRVRGSPRGPLRAHAGVRRAPRLVISSPFFDKNAVLTKVATFEHAIVINGKVLWLILRVAKFPRGQLSAWPIFSVANFPRGQFSTWLIFRVANWQSRSTDHMLFEQSTHLFSTLLIYTWPISRVAKFPRGQF